MLTFIDGEPLKAAPLLRGPTVLARSIAEEVVNNLQKLMISRVRI